jgi:hypothetical protein
MRASFRPTIPSLFLVLLASSFVACAGSDDGGGPSGDSAVTDTRGTDARTDGTTPDTLGTDGASPDVTPTDGAIDDTAASDTATTEGAVDVEPEAAADTAPTKCTTDDDCRTYSVQCDGKCECLALSSTETDPICTKPIACFVDPCRGKTARCGAGNVCVVE